MGYTCRILVCTGISDGSTNGLIQVFFRYTIWILRTIWISWIDWIGWILWISWPNNDCLIFNVSYIHF
ncbi:MAG TPA: hypothetical protein DD627_07220 [Pediococcus sp.]|nr:hypothetical protein [Pediococcus sp.]